MPIFRLRREERAPAAGRPIAVDAYFASYSARPAHALHECLGPPGAQREQRQRCIVDDLPFVIISPERHLGTRLDGEDFAWPDARAIQEGSVGTPEILEFPTSPVPSEQSVLRRDVAFLDTRRTIGRSPDEVLGFEEFRVTRGT
jgi:hypothetical protein